jgi:hypothetical protein
VPIGVRDSKEDRMDIGPARRIIEVEPVSQPLPEEAPELEPAPVEPERRPVT